MAAKRFQYQLQAMSIDMDIYLPAALSSNLACLSNDELIALEQRLRSYGWHVYDAWPADAAIHIANSSCAERKKQVLLFIASAHHNGRERQKAMQVLPGCPGRLTLIAALIRTVDWAEPVRLAARAAVTELFDVCSTEDIVAAWSVFLRMMERERSRDGWLADTLQSQAMHRIDARFLSLALASDAPAVRLWAARLSIQRGELTHGAALRIADPRIALFALKHAQSNLDPASMPGLASAGLHARHPAVRRESLRMLAGSDPAAAADALPGALLDSSRGVRHLAIHLARPRGLDPRVIWYPALDIPRVRTRRAVLASLAESAEPADADIFHRFLLAASSKLRQPALKGWLRLGQTLNLEQWSGLLEGDDGAVHALLLDAIKSGALSLDATEMEYFIAHRVSATRNHAVLRKLLAGVGFWGGLEILMAVHVDASQSDVWLSIVDDWIGRSTRYVPILPMHKRRVQDRVNARAPALGQERKRKIDAVLDVY